MIIEWGRDYRLDLALRGLEDMRVAINGTGIAGPTLAFWLKATVSPDVLVSLGALSAVGTPDGGWELPGSAASTRRASVARAHPIGNHAPPCGGPCTSSRSP